VKPDERFLAQPRAFWANVRTISQGLGYTRNGQIATFSVKEMASALEHADLKADHLGDLGPHLEAYFQHRADLLNGDAQGYLMDLDDARLEFDALFKKLNPQCPIPMNKQKGEKAVPAYLTGITNMIIEANTGGRPVCYDPRALTSFTRDDAPLRTLSRRVDGCFPNHVNPIALWEIKEYYHTTTFGSRVADGVYETLLDGLELQELRDTEGVYCDHVLILDSHRTWWGSGKSYLCRIVDMLNMGCVTEVLFGREVMKRLPQLASEWSGLTPDGSCRPRRHAPFRTLWPDNVARNDASAGTGP
jgi:hypothetical protein